MAEFHTTLFGIYTRIGTTRLLIGITSAAPIAIYSSPIIAWIKNSRTTGTCIAGN